MTSIKSKLQKWKLPKLMMILLLLLAGMTGIGVVYANNNETSRLERQLELGDRYLEDLDYEQAIAAYEEALRIDDKCVEAYVGIAKAYVCMGDLDMAIQYLEIGVEKTESPVLIANLAVLRLMNAPQEEPEEELEEETQVTEVIEETEEEEPEEETEEEEPPKKKPVKKEPEEETEEVTEEAEEPIPYIPQPQPPVSQELPWIDELYSKLINNDYQAVLSIINAPDFLTRCEPYRYEGWGGSGGESGYRLITSDGKTVGVYHNSLTAVFYCEHPADDSGFECTTRGDHEVGGRMDGYYWWFDGSTFHDSDGAENEIPEGDVCSIWHT